MAQLTGARELMDKKMRKMIKALTNDPLDFPKAVKIGSVHTDVATIRIDGVTSKPLEILTGADGSYDIYADGYDEHGLPGRIIIELHRPVISENDEVSHGSATSCVCKKCECRMVGYPGDDECSDCAFPALARASEAATRAVEDRHFKQTGERKRAGELLRRAIGIEESPNAEALPRGGAKKGNEHAQD